LGRNPGFPIFDTLSDHCSVNQRKSGCKRTVFLVAEADPQAMGMSSIVLDDMNEALKQKGTQKLLIIKNDHIVYEWFAEGWQDSVCGHYCASLAKALVGGMSLMVALDNELLFPDMPVCAVIPEWQNEGEKSRITIRHLATHTSGLDDAEVKTEIQEQMQKHGLSYTGVGCRSG
jgi:CubicO group peptidase (beta-lactamase class C family)